MNRSTLSLTPLDLVPLLLEEAPFMGTPITPPRLEIRVTRTEPIVPSGEAASRFRGLAIQGEEETN